MSVLILPMRDWNIPYWLRRPSNVPFWSYLWGIEILATTSSNKFPKCFDLTYEGLKYQYRRQYRRCHRRFDLTYEGLKWKICVHLSNSLVMFWSYLWGIEIMPFFPAASRAYAGFWSYLWGIEIITNMKNKSTIMRFDLTYEGLKYIYTHFNWFQPFCFDLTYEGLKWGR